MHHELKSIISKAIEQIMNYEDETCDWTRLGITKQQAERVLARRMYFHLFTSEDNKLNINGELLIDELYDLDFADFINEKES